MLLQPLPVAHLFYPKAFSPTASLIISISTGLFFFISLPPKATLSDTLPTFAGTLNFGFSFLRLGFAPSLAVRGPSGARVACRPSFLDNLASWPKAFRHDPGDHLRRSERPSQIGSDQVRLTTIQICTVARDGQRSTPFAAGEAARLSRFPPIALDTGTETVNVAVQRLSVIGCCKTAAVLCQARRRRWAFYYIIPAATPG